MKKLNLAEEVLTFLIQYCWDMEKREDAGEWGWDAYWNNRLYRAPFPIADLLLRDADTVRINGLFYQVIDRDNHDINDSWDVNDEVYILRLDLETYSGRAPPFDRTVLIPLWKTK